MAVVLETLARSLAAVAVLYLAARLIGKKQISQLTFFDYVSGISIGSIAAEFALDPELGLARGLTCLAAFVVFAIALHFFSRISYMGRKLLEGRPSILIQRGQIIWKNLKRSRLTVNDLIEECRLKGAFNISDIEYAVFETKGELSVMLKPEKQPLNFMAMNLRAPGGGLCTNLVVDGKALTGNLAALNRDELWLRSELGKLGVADVSSLVLCCQDETGVLYAFGRDSAGAPRPLM